MNGTKRIMRIMAAHQPNFLPYLGFFDKMRKADVFVIRDEVQFSERDYHHRNRIRINTCNNDKPQPKWIRIPVHKEHRCLRDIMIKNSVKDKNVPWNIFMLKQIKNSYRNAPFFRKFYPGLEEIILDMKERLIDLNMEIISYLQHCFNIKQEIVFASSLGCKKTNNPSADLVEIAKAVDANLYLSGTGARGYLNQQLFHKEGMEVRFQQFSHPVYMQQGCGFIPNMASIDALFNAGDIFDGQTFDKKSSDLVSYRNTPHISFYPGTGITSQVKE